MDFAKVLDTVAGFLEERGFRFALVGAFALSVHGRSRATQDLDLAVDLTAQRQLVAFLESLGYETLHCSEGYSNHLHPLAPLGRVDCIYVAEPTAGQLFDGATVTRVAGRRIRVPRPEHLAAMKVLAMKNDPWRTFQEMADLQHLLGLPGVDRMEIRGYFEQQRLLERYDELRKILEAS